MSQTTVLVIDDSATIRRLVDTNLSPAGYHVVLAPNAEDGLEKAAEVMPDLILLDHQLPGTTGFQVCQQLLADPELAKIPVVVSSTLRKKAYVEYADAANVVDMLPKPYAPELLLTTVANGLETGQLIVSSQSDGSAIPEVIQELQEVTLNGNFDSFGLREVLDFLNNGGKSGMLDVETDRNRVSFFIDKGRIQAVTSTGVNPDEITSTLPEALKDLAPVVTFTVGGRFSAEVDGLVQLLDKKVIDQRLLRNLLRHQAALLTWRCFHVKLKSFRFEANAALPPLFQKLRLDISLVALMVDGALRCEESALPEQSPQTAYGRSAIRGQNLDRAGLTAKHMKILSKISEPLTVNEIAGQVGFGELEVRRVLHGMQLAELVERQERLETRSVVALEHDAEGGQILRSLLSAGARGYSGRVVRDQLGMQLLMKRSRPDVVLIAQDSEDFQKVAEQTREDDGPLGVRVPWVAILPKDDSGRYDEIARKFDAVLHRPFNQQQVVDVLNTLDGGAAPQPSAATSEPARAEQEAELVLT